MSGFSGGDQWAPNYIGGGNLWSDEALELAYKLAEEAAIRRDAEYRSNHPVKWWIKKVFWYSLLTIGVILWLLYWFILGAWPLLILAFALYKGF